jgi:hypothetical protein
MKGFTSSSPFATLKVLKEKLSTLGLSKLPE